MGAATKATVRPMRLEEALLDVVVLMIAGFLWLSDKPACFLFHPSLQNKSTRGIYETAKGNICIGAYKGNLLYNPKSQTVKSL